MIHGPFGHFFTFDVDRNWGQVQEVRKSLIPWTQNWGPFSMSNAFKSI